MGYFCHKGSRELETCLFLGVRHGILYVHVHGHLLLLSTIRCPPVIILHKLSVWREKNRLSKDFFQSPFSHPHFKYWHHCLLTTTLSTKIFNVVKSKAGTCLGAWARPTGWITLTVHSTLTFWLKWMLWFRQQEVGC